MRGENAQDGRTALQTDHWTLRPMLQWLTLCTSLAHIHGQARL